MDGSSTGIAMCHIAGFIQELRMSPSGQETDIAVPALDPHSWGYGNPWFSVQAVAYTEIISFPYTPSDLDPPGPKIALNHG